jgi:hypothetical protein
LEREWNVFVGHARAHAPSQLSQLSSSGIEPDRLSANRKPLVTEIFPASASGQFVQLAKTEGACGRNSPIVSGHPFRIDECREQIDRCAQPVRSSQIGHQNRAPRKFAAPLQYFYRIFIAKMM